MAYKEKSDSELMSGQACWMRENKYFQQCKEQKLLKIYNVRKKNNCSKIGAQVFLYSSVFPVFPKHSVGLTTCPAGSNCCTCHGVTLTDSAWGQPCPSL